MLKKYKTKIEANNFCRGQIRGQANFLGQAKIYGQAKFEAKRKTRRIFRPGQWGKARPWFRVCRFINNCIISKCATCLHEA